MRTPAAREHIREGVRRFEALVGFPPKWFRPPYGSQNLRTYLAARGSGMKVVGWSADCADWTDQPAPVLAELALSRLRPGGILLAHDALAADPQEVLAVSAVDRRMLVDLILQGMKERGYSGVSMSTLLRGRRAHHTAWFRP
jgi:peptidoglycan/xylan/chitin deacetylase (PgdA/CDA1 family)